MLAFLWVKSFSKMGKLTNKTVFYCFIFTILYGCFDEFHQTFVPGRYGGLSDIYLDAVGAVLGIILAMKIIKLMKL